MRQLSEYARSDETTINILSEKATAKQYIWVYMSGVQKNASVVFEYHPTRNGQIATNFFKDFKGRIGFFAGIQKVLRLQRYYIV